MEDKEEILEEIEEIKDDQATVAANNKIDNMLDQVMENTTVLPQKDDINTNTNANVSNDAAMNVESIDSNVDVLNPDTDYVEPKKSKTIILIILIVLLLLDIIALVLYLIGLDKLGFIQ